MNFGQGIAVSLALFMGFIGYLAYRTFQENTDLVSDNYYEEEVVFQETINAVENTNALHGKVIWTKGNGELKVKFPEEFKGGEIKANVSFLCPSDKEKDIELEIDTPVENQFFVNLSDFKAGPYRMQLSWQADHENYYYEELIVF